MRTRLGKIVVKILCIPFLLWYMMMFMEVAFVYMIVVFVGHASRLNALYHVSPIQFLTI